MGTRTGMGTDAGTENLSGTIKKLFIKSNKAIFKIGIGVCFRYEPLLDSSNMSMEDWSRIATDIGENAVLFNIHIVQFNWYWCIAIGKDSFYED